MYRCLSEHRHEALVTRGLVRQARPPRPRTVGRASRLRGLVLVLLMLGSNPGRAEASGPTGQWWAEGGFAKVEIRSCGDALCGQVVWLRHPLDAEGCALLDVENPDEALRTRPVEGLAILHGLRASSDAPNEWSGGTIYDPSSGRTYSAFAEMEGPDRLRVRGYFGIRLLGRTTTWVRVGSEDQCSQPG